jgi:hypothetical protein
MFASIELLNLRHSKNLPLPARSPFLEQLTNQIIWRCKRPKVKSLRLLCPTSFKIICEPIANEVDSHKMRWRFCLGGFIVAREVGRRMLPLRRGTIIFVGSTSGMVGRPNHLNLAVGKFGLRALSQVMARELLPNRIHVVHLVIDGEIQEEPTAESSDPELCPEDISDLIYSLHRQPMSTWTSELDVRPWNEKFWEHC